MLKFTGEIYKDYLSGDLILETVVQEKGQPSIRHREQLNPLVFKYTGIVNYFLQSFINNVIIAVSKDLGIK